MTPGAEHVAVIHQGAAPSPTYTALDSGACAAPNQYDGMAKKPTTSRLERQISDDYLKPLPDDDQYDYISTPDASDDAFKVVFHK